MARRFTLANSQRLLWTGAASWYGIGEPLTLMGRMLIRTSGVQQTCCAIGAAVGNEQWLLATDGTEAVRGWVANSAGSAAGAIAGVAPLRRWFHLGAVYTSTVSRTAYLDGIAGAVETTNISVQATPPNSFRLGSRYFSGAEGNYLEGDIADVRVYDYALSAAEMLAASKGRYPNRRPVLLTPSWGGELGERDIVDPRRYLTPPSAISTPSIAPDPPGFARSLTTAKIFDFAAAAAGTKYPQIERNHVRGLLRGVAR